MNKVLLCVLGLIRSSGRKNSSISPIDDTRRKIYLMIYVDIFGCKGVTRVRRRTNGKLCVTRRTSACALRVRYLADAKVFFFLRYLHYSLRIANGRKWLDVCHPVGFRGIEHLTCLEKTDRWWVKIVRAERYLRQVDEPQWAFSLITLPPRRYAIECQLPRLISNHTYIYAHIHTPTENIHRRLIQLLHQSANSAIRWKEMSERLYVLIAHHNWKGRPRLRRNYLSLRSVSRLE